MVRSAAPLALDTSLTAHTWKAEDLIKEVARGRLTTPFFQRPLKWEDADRVALFDSIRRGFPIGTLLLRQRPADRKPARLGSLELPAPSEGNVFEIVDGQQRVHTLAAAALLPSDGDLRPIYYDLEEFTFGVVPRSRRKIPDHWLMVATAIDSAKLVDWLVDVGLPKKQRGEAIAVGKRLREYDVPSYILETDDVAIAREVFRRTNQRGRDRGERTPFRAALRTIREHSESEAAAALARQAADAAPIVKGDGVRNPARLDHAGPRILCAAMARLGPVDVRDETPIDVGRLFRDEEDPLVILAPGAKGPLGQSLANRLLHPPVEPNELLTDLAALPESAWASHVIDASILDAIARGQNDEALERRAKLLAEKLGTVLDARAEWKHSDRPSIEALLGGAAE